MALQSKPLGYGTVRRATATDSKLNITIVHVVIIMLILSCTQSPQPGRGVGVGVASVGAHALQIKSHTFSSCRLFLNCLKRPHKPLISLCEPPMGKCGYDPVVGLVSQVSKLVSQFTFFRKRLVTLMSIYLYYSYLAC